MKNGIENKVKNNATTLVKNNKLLANEIMNKSAHFHADKNNPEYIKLLSKVENLAEPNRKELFQLISVLLIAFSEQLHKSTKSNKNKIEKWHEFVNTAYFTMDCSANNPNLHDQYLSQFDIYILFVNEYLTCVVTALNENDASFSIEMAHKDIERYMPRIPFTINSYEDLIKIKMLENADKPSNEESAADFLLTRLINIRICVAHILRLKGEYKQAKLHINLMKNLCHQLTKYVSKISLSSALLSLEKNYENIVEAEKESENNVSTTTPSSTVDNLHHEFDRLSLGMQTSVQEGKKQDLSVNTNDANEITERAKAILKEVSQYKASKNNPQYNKLFAEIKSYDDAKRNKLFDAFTGIMYTLASQCKKIQNNPLESLLNYSGQANAAYFSLHCLAQFPQLRLLYLAHVDIYLHFVYEYLVNTEMLIRVNDKTIDKEAIQKYSEQYLSLMPYDKKTISDLLLAKSQNTSINIEGENLSEEDARVDLCHRLVHSQILMVYILCHLNKSEQINKYTKLTSDLLPLLKEHLSAEHFKALFYSMEKNRNIVEAQHKSINFTIQPTAPVNALQSTILSQADAAQSAILTQAALGILAEVSEIPTNKATGIYDEILNKYKINEYSTLTKEALITKMHEQLTFCSQEVESGSENDQLDKYRKRINAVGFTIEFGTSIRTPKVLNYYLSNIEFLLFFTEKYMGTALALFKQNNVAPNMNLKTLREATNYAHAFYSTDFTVEYISRLMTVLPCLDNLNEALSLEDYKAKQCSRILDVMLQFSQIAHIAGWRELSKGYISKAKVTLSRLKAYLSVDKFKELEKRLSLEHVGFKDSNFSENIIKLFSEANKDLTVRMLTFNMQGLGIQSFNTMKAHENLISKLDEQHKLIPAMDESSFVEKIKETISLLNQLKPLELDKDKNIELLEKASCLISAWQEKFKEKDALLDKMIYEHLAEWLQHIQLAKENCNDNFAFNFGVNTDDIITNIKTKDSKTNKKKQKEQAPLKTNQEKQEKQEKQKAAQEREKRDRQLRQAMKQAQKNKKVQNNQLNAMENEEKRATQEKPAVVIPKESIENEKSSPIAEKAQTQKLDKKQLQIEENNKRKAQGRLLKKEMLETQKREAKEREAKEREAKEREAKEREAKEREAKEREAKEREAKEREAKEREAKEREAKEREAKERDAKERNAKERNAKERNAKEHEAKTQKRSVNSMMKQKKDSKKASEAKWAPTGNTPISILKRETILEKEEPQAPIKAIVHNNAQPVTSIQVSLHQSVQDTMTILKSNGFEVALKGDYLLSRVLKKLHPEDEQVKVKVVDCETNCPPELLALLFPLAKITQDPYLPHLYTMKTGHALEIQFSCSPYLFSNDSPPLQYEELFCRVEEGDVDITHPELMKGLESKNGNILFSKFGSDDLMAHLGNHPEKILQALKTSSKFDINLPAAFKKGMHAQLHKICELDFNKFIYHIGAILNDENVQKHLAFLHEHQLLAKILPFLEENHIDEYYEQLMNIFKEIAKMPSGNKKYQKSDLFSILIKPLLAAPFNLELEGCLAQYPQLRINEFDKLVWTLAIRNFHGSHDMFGHCTSAHAVDFVKESKQACAYANANRFMPYYNQQLQQNVHRATNQTILQKGTKKVLNFFAKK